MLPRYVVARKRPNGTVYYWQVPPRLRVTSDAGTWPDGLVRLPDDHREMLTHAASLNRELDALRKGVVPCDRKGTMPWLIEQYEKSSYCEDLHPRTKMSYLYLSRRITRWSEEKGNPPVASLTKPKILEFLSGYDKRRSLRDHMASYLGGLLEFACRIGMIEQNPARKLGLKRARRRKPIRTVTIAQLMTIVTKAREMGMPHVAMGCLLHFDLGQRQGDILRLQKPRDYRAGTFQFHQSKTDQVVTIKPFLTETREALDALPATQMMLVSDADGSALNQRIYQRDFRTVANACGFTDLWEMELRHSCVVYAEQAGLTPGEIATRTGHGLASVIQILENYRYRDNTVASQGAIKLEDYRNKSLSR